MLANDHAFTATGKIKRPTYATVATWVKESWDDVSVELIKKSFKCCGVSTKLDGSEDDQVFDYDKVLDSDDEVEDLESDEEEYPEEGNYKNNWNIGNRDDKVDDEVDDEFDDEFDDEVNDEDGESSKGKESEENEPEENESEENEPEENEPEDEYQDSDDEDIRAFLRMKYKRKFNRKVGCSFR